MGTTVGTMAAWHLRTECVAYSYHLRTMCVSITYLIGTAYVADTYQFTREISVKYE